MKNTKRKSNFNDTALQGWLLAALVVLELVFLIAALAYLNNVFNEIVDQNLYRSHRVSTDVLIGQMFHALYQVVLLMLAINIVAITLAHFIWGHFVNSILDQLRTIHEKIARLDLSFFPSKTTYQHDVIRKSTQWIELERKRCSEIRELVSQLPDNEQNLAKSSVLLPLVNEIQKTIKSPPDMFTG